MFLGTGQKIIHQTFPQAILFSLYYTIFDSIWEDKKTTNRKNFSAILYKARFSGAMRPPGGGKKEKKLPSRRGRQRTGIIPCSCYFFFLPGAAMESIISTAVVTPRPMRSFPFRLCWASFSTMRAAV